MGGLVAIDPGVHSVGLAYFVRGTLVAARNLPLEKALGFLHERSDVLVLELPQTYGGRAANGDGSSLIALAAVVGRFRERASIYGATVHEFLPRAWKGTVKPQVCCERVWALLSADERAAFELTPQSRAALAGTRAKLPESATHPLDAAGMGLLVLGRARRGMCAVRVAS